MNARTFATIVPSLYGDFPKGFLSFIWRDPQPDLLLTGRVFCRGARVSASAEEEKTPRRNKADNISYIVQLSLGYRRWMANRPSIVDSAPEFILISVAETIAS